MDENLSHKMLLYILSESSSFTPYEGSNPTIFPLTMHPRLHDLLSKQALFVAGTP